MEIVNSIYMDIYTVHVQSRCSVSVASDTSPADAEFKHRRQFCLNEFKVFEKKKFSQKLLYFSIVHIKKYHIVYHKECK